MKLKIYKMLRIVLVIAIIVVSIFVIKKFYNEYKTNSVAKEVIQKIETSREQEEKVVNKIDAEINGYRVIGIIRIPKFAVEYPILEITNEESLNLSVTKFWGNEINEIGNVTLAGHNSLSGGFFGKLKNLSKGDIIELTDIQNVTLKYEVYDMIIIDPNDISYILPDEEGRREVTLVTCANGKVNRRIVKAKEVV